MSDHGYNLGEHDAWSKVSLWEGSIRAPLIISAPGLKFEHNHGTKCKSIVEFIDLYPTVADFAGLHSEIPEILQGKNLMDNIIDSDLNNPESYAYSITRGGEAGFLRTDRWRYSRWGEDSGPGNEELYDHYTDPEEHVNLADDPKKYDVLEEMRRKYVKARDKARNGLNAESFLAPLSSGK
jgi:iduronate 2-sulfatase